MFKLLIYEYLLNSADKKVFQADIAKYLKCSAMHVSKVIKELIVKGVIVKDSKNAVAVINPFLLCCALAFEKERVKPLFFQAPEFKDVLEVLKKTEYALTLDSAKQVLNHETPKIIQAHVLENHLEILKKYFNQISSVEQANLIIYPAKINHFSLTQNINGVIVANDWQIIIDNIRENKIRNLKKIM